MNKSVKTFMLASLAAFSCSITACANNQGVGVDEVNNGSVANDSGQVSNLFTVSKRTTTPTDFTYAAENTVNGVVSIKSFATPRSSYRAGSDAFSDPFFDFFFGMAHLSFNL